MQKQFLNGTWQMTTPHGEPVSGAVPGSVYSIMLENGEMEDPYWRDNELEALKIMNHDFAFYRTFLLPDEMADCPVVVLRCDGLDTLCDIYINDQLVGGACNMHRIWEYDVTQAVRSGENKIAVCFRSPTHYIEEKNEESYIGGSRHAMKGFPHLRKAHCMFGWDWGPRLPDMGIWRDIYLLGVDSSRIEDVVIEQTHESGEVSVTVAVAQSARADVKISIVAPDNAVYTCENGEACRIEAPRLWWPNGLGEHPLYTVRIELLENGSVVDSVIKRIGLRSMSVTVERDSWGKSFAHCVNGVNFFAMGADYIPEDNLLSRITPERTRKLLEQCAAANFNTVRVWGGGYYPDDFFFDICDELGLVVWQDFMFACANYLLDFEFEENITAELVDNIRRIRHHACLGLWCGNNEMEMFQQQYAYDGTEVTKAHYIRMFEHIIPHILRKEDPQTFYWPASPSSGGSFHEPNDPDMGDVHYWDVWHGNKPFDDCRNYTFRYVSEFGFQSLPCLKTVESFTLPEDRNLFSRVMEMHQRNEGANGKIMNYLSQTFLYPTGFETLLYASQLLQAEAVKYGVEHWRRNRGRCMGAIYWQLNDIWPVASWASVDYYGRWKALHYYARRFFAPIMISCHETGETSHRVSVVVEPSRIETKARLSVANETMNDVYGTVEWSLRDSLSNILKSGKECLSVSSLSSKWLDELDFGSTDFLNNHFSYSFSINETVVSCGSVLFTAPKHYKFRNPELAARVEGNTIRVTANAYAKCVEIQNADNDLVLSDNYFDMEKGTVILEIINGTPSNLALRSVYDIR